MWQGKKKAVTFSFDDGVLQDIDIIAVLNKYGLKGTFNLNSGYLGCPGALDRMGEKIPHSKVPAYKVKDIYAGHEVAVHTLTHPNLTTLDEQTIIRQVEEDRKALSTLVGYDVIGMAYPCGGINNDDRVAEIIRKNTPIRYARTITSTHDFKTQENLLRFHPSGYLMEWDKVFELVEKFLNEPSDEPRLLYLWGHSYEKDMQEEYLGNFEKICQMLSGKDDIYYGTNKEVLL